MPLPQSLVLAKVPFMMLYKGNVHMALNKHVQGAADLVLWILGTIGDSSERS